MNVIGVDENVIEYECLECDFKCSNEEQMIEHKTIHLTKQSSNNDGTNTTETNLSMHNDNENKNTFSAELLNNLTVDNMHKYNGNVFYISSKMFVCLVCERSFAQRKFLVQHVKKHGGGEKRDICQGGKKKFACSECEYKCISPDRLRRHMVLTHSDDRPFACSECEYKGISQGQLRQHMIKHMRIDDRPFKCPHCEHRSKTKGHLKDHLSTHTGERPYMCTICGYAARKNSLLNEHILIHKDEKNFSCSICKYIGKTHRNLKRHIENMHSVDKPFVCDECGFRVATGARLKSHMKIHSEEKVT